MVAIIDMRRAAPFTSRFGLSAAIQAWRKRKVFAAVFSTPSRMANLLLRMAAFCLHNPEIGGLPVHLKVDVAPMCQLRCPVCFHGETTTRLNTPGLMKLDAFRTLVEEVYRSTSVLSLYNLGEPLLHPDIAEMVKIAGHRKLATYITTNLSLRLRPGHLAALTSSGLTMLLVAIDGVGTQTFGRERKGGRWDLVEANLAELARLKRAGAKTRLTLQFIVFDFNAHEVATLRDFADRYALDEVHIIEGATKPWTYSHRPSDSPRLKRRTLLPHCPWPFFSAVVLSDGNVNPCCHYRMSEPYQVEGPRERLGRFPRQSLREIYGSGEARKARRMVSNPKREIADGGGFCAGCRMLTDNTPEVAAFEPTRAELIPS